MATNKNALIRYKVLDQCFRNFGKRYYIEDLITNCNRILETVDPKSSGISRRQIFQDIAFMESAEGWSIEVIRHKNGKRVYYRYANTNYSINNLPLDEIEIDKLTSAVAILGQFKGMPQFEWIGEIAAKLNLDLPLLGAGRNIIAFDSNPYLQGIEKLGEVYQAIYHKKVLLIGYQPFLSDHLITLIFHPYYIRQFNNRWFVYGYNFFNQRSDWNLALDRIHSIDEQNDPYVENTSIDWADYFEDIIGVTKPDGAKTESILLYFKGITGKYIESKPLHGSQKSRWLDSHTLEVRLELIVNFEFEQILLSYCDTLEILHPLYLNERIKKRIQLAMANFCDLAKLDSI